MYCNECGTMIEDNERFCGNCGAISHTSQQKIEKIEQENSTINKKNFIKYGRKKLFGLIIVLIMLGIGMGTSYLTQKNSGENESKQMKRMPSVSNNPINTDISADKDTVNNDLEKQWNLIQENIKHLNDNNLLKAEKELLTSYEDEYSSDVKEKDYSKAQQDLNEWILFIGQISSRAEKNIILNQIDVSSFPIVKVNIKFITETTGKSAEIANFEQLSLFEKIGNSGSYEKKKIHKLIHHQEEYTIEYETSESLKTTKRNLYLSYTEQGNPIRYEFSFLPSDRMDDLLDKEDTAGKMIMINSEVEAEVLKIRDIWNQDKEAITKDIYNQKTICKGVKSYYDKNGIHIIEVRKGTNSIDYARTYDFFEGKLIFAYLEGADSHRLYLKDDVLFRWRYTPDISNPDNAVNNDNTRELQEYLNWEKFVLDEGYKYCKE